MEIKEEYEIVGDVAYKTQAEKIRDYKKRWVSVSSLADRIETICNHGNERDMRFRNLLLIELNALTPDSEPKGSTHNSD